MSKSAVYVVDIIGDAFAKTGLIKQYMYGAGEEIEANLIEITSAQGLAGSEALRKYPLAALFCDFPEARTGEYYAQIIIPKIIIATVTDNTFKSPKRYTENFKPILYPIYYRFLEELAKNKYIVNSDPNNFTHIKWDRLYWGSKPAGKGLNDYVDAIEIQNLKLVLQQFC